MDTLPRLRIPIRALVSGMQFGFREDLLAMDALNAVVSHTRNKINGGKIVLAVNLDITNAFNAALGVYQMYSNIENIRIICVEYWTVIYAIDS